MAPGIDVPCDFGMLIINIGDMLQEASRATTPRPSTAWSTRPAKARARAASRCRLFLHPRNEVVLSDRYTAHSYLQERLRELGVKT